MTTPPFPELRLLASLETAEAVGRNMEDAVRFSIGALVGTDDPATAPLTATGECTFDIGDGAIWNFMERLLTSICIGFVSLTNRLAQITRAIEDVIKAFLGDLLTGIVQQFNALVTSLTTALTGAVTAITDQVKRVVETVVSTLSGLVTTIAAKVREVVDALDDILGAIFTRIGTIVDGILSRLRTGFSALLGAAQAVLDRIGTGVSTVITALIQAVLDVLNKIGTGITAIVEPLVGAAESGLARVRQVIEDIPSTLREITTEVGEFLGEKIGAPLSSVGELFITQVEAFFARLIDELEVSPQTILRDFLRGLGMTDEIVERFAQSADNAMPRTPAIFALGAVAIIPLVAGPLISAILQPAVEEVRQEVAERVTPTLIPTAESLDAFIRGEMTEAQFRKELGEAGYSTERMDILLRTSRRLLDLGELFRWWLRGIIDDGELDALLTMQKIAPEDQARLKEAVFFIPPVQDLIRMAVREVFSPEVRERFGQDQDFPPDFATFGAQQGVSEFWAQAYWAAHWALPSPQQGFEMLHRGVIEQSDLNLLLRALDVMPFWRDRLTAIAFRPLTRVDLRRMHKLGLLTEEELQTRYEALGFNEDDARKMVAFTIEFNREDPPEQPGELEGLTRATVLGMYDDGIINRAQAGSVLVELGFSEDATELFLLQRDLEIERAERREEIRLVLDQVKAGAITFEQGQDKLGQIGLEPDELAKATVTIIREQERQTAIPPRGDLDKMHAADLIDDSQYVQALRNRGFSLFWADNYLALLRRA